MGEPWTAVAGGEVLWVIRGLWDLWEEKMELDDQKGS